MPEDSSRRRHIRPELVPEICVRKKLAGHVYLMRRAGACREVKIGFSVRPEVRAKEIGASVAHSVFTPDMRGLERAMHSHFLGKSLHVPGTPAIQDGDTEWFAVSLDDAIGALGTLAQQYNSPKDEYVVHKPSEMLSGSYKPYYDNYFFWSYQKMDAIQFCVRRAKGLFCDLTCDFNHWSRAIFDRVLSCLAFNWDVRQAETLGKLGKRPNCEIRSELDQVLNVWSNRVIGRAREESIFCPNVRRKHIYAPAKGQFLEFYSKELSEYGRGQVWYADLLPS
jgi:hypothetical protein